MDKPFRCARKKYRVKLRKLGLRADDKVRLDSIKSNFVLVSILNDFDEDLEMIELEELIVLEYFSLTVTQPMNIPRVLRLDRTIESFANENCDTLFRFEFSELHRLKTVLQIPERAILSNGSNMSGEEVFLYSLMRLSFPSRHEILSDQYFGRENSQWSRAFCWFNNFLFKQHSFRLLNYWNFWLNLFPVMADSIQKKILKYGYDVEAGEVWKIVGFIDNNVKKVNRVGSGPTFDRGDYDYIDPRDHPRRLMNDPIQRAFYSGYKKCHSIAFQTIGSPYGLCMHMWGPGANRHNDLHRLQSSQVNAKLALLQHGQDIVYKVHGDGIYYSSQCISTNFKGKNLTEQQKSFNRTTPKVRIEIEWEYNDTSTLFKYVDWRENMKILSGGTNVAMAYFSATLLRNCHVCLYGSTTSRHFGMRMELEKYMAVE